MDANPPLRSVFDLALWAALIEFAGAIIIAGYVAAAAVALVRRRGLARVQGLVAEGALTGLSVKLAATLLKTILLHTWEQVFVFAVIFALRTILKRVFAWERERARRGAVVE